MQSHIGCIYSTFPMLEITLVESESLEIPIWLDFFLLYVFKCLHQSMQSHTGCICNFFPCVFSNDSPNWTRDERFTATLITLVSCTFLQKSGHLEHAKSHWLHFIQFFPMFDFSPLCVFKCFLFANFLHGWIFLIFFYHILLFIFKCVLNVSVCILNSDIWIRISWYSNLVGLFSAVFFSLCVFKWVLKLNTWKDTKSHWLHLLVVFSPLRVFKCVPKLPAMSHWLHFCDFLPTVCIWWFLKLSTWWDT